MSDSLYYPRANWPEEEALLRQLRHTIRAGEALAECRAREPDDPDGVDEEDIAGILYLLRQAESRVECVLLSLPEDIPATLRAKYSPPSREEAPGRSRKRKSP